LTGVAAQHLVRAAKHQTGALGNLANVLIEKGSQRCAQPGSLTRVGAGYQGGGCYQGGGAPQAETIPQLPRTTDISGHKASFINHSSIPCSHRPNENPSEAFQRSYLKETVMRVLLMEDDESAARSIDLMLKSNGFDVYATELGKEGVASSASHRPETWAANGCAV
jgi:hypothetical protein